MTVIWSDRPTRRPFKRMHRSSRTVPSTPPPTPIFKKPLQLTPDSTPSSSPLEPLFTKPVSASSGSPASKSLNYNKSTFKITNTKSGSLPTPETTPSKSGEKRKYSGIFAVDSDSDDDNDDLSHIPIRPNKLKPPRKTYRNYDQLQTPSPTPKRLFDRKGAEIPKGLHRALITPSTISPLGRSKPSILTPKRSTASQSSNPGNRRSFRATAPSPSPTPSLSTPHTTTPNSSFSAPHAPIYSGRMSLTPGTRTSASSFPPPQTTASTSPSSTLKLGINISPAELSRVSELILKRTPWDEIAVYVASNRTGSIYRDATERALGYVVDLMGQNENGCTVNTDDGCTIAGTTDFGGNADGCCDSEQEHESVASEDDDMDGYGDVFEGRVQVPGGWRRSVSIKEESTDDEEEEEEEEGEEEEEWYGCEE